MKKQRPYPLRIVKYKNGVPIEVQEIPSPKVTKVKKPVDLPNLSSIAKEK